MPRRISNKRNVKRKEIKDSQMRNKCKYINHLIHEFENEWGCCSRCSEWIHVTDFIKGIKQL